MKIREGESCPSQRSGWQDGGCRRTDSVPECLQGARTTRKDNIERTKQYMRNIKQ